jgi:ABC-type transporter Mla MlaB component
VLRITVNETGQMTKIMLEGKLSGPWVLELERVWAAAKSQEPLNARQIAADISDVTFIDAAGKQLLARMHKEGVILRASGCMNRSIVERIEQVNGR